MQLSNIICHTYKRTRDDWFIFSNASQLATALGWKSIDCFLLFLEEELNIRAYYDIDNKKCYISSDTNIRNLNELVTKYYNIMNNCNGIC